MNALEVEAAVARAEAAADAEDDDDKPILAVSGEDALRADLAASGAELFEDEDDDDQPILGGRTTRAHAGVRLARARRAGPRPRGSRASTGCRTGAVVVAVAGAGDVAVQRGRRPVLRSG